MTDEQFCADLRAFSGMLKRGEDLDKDYLQCLLLDSADMIEEAQTDLDEANDEAMALAQAVENELATMGHSRGNSMRALQQVRAFIAGRIVSALKEPGDE